MTRLRITCTSTVSRKPCCWLREVSYPRLHLETACGGTPPAFVMEGVGLRRLVTPALQLVCPGCQRALEKAIKIFEEDNDASLFPPEAG